MSFLRKQKSGLLCACYGVPAGQAGTLGYFLDSRFRGNDTPQPASFRWSRPFPPGESPTGDLTSRSLQRCFIRLKCSYFPAGRV